MAAPTQLPQPQRWNRYPMDLRGTRKSKRALTVYHDRLAREENHIFVVEPKPQFVVLWDLRENENVFQPETKLEQLKETMGDSSPNTSCRFIFLHTESSRGKLCCSRDQLNQVLTCHDVMPAILDFCFEFKNREKPTTTAMFRFEDHLSLQQPLVNPRIQHVFNIIAPEEDRRRDSYPWPIRHTTVYHSFDLAEGKSVWIIIKGNRLIRDRITSSEETLHLDHADTKEKKAIGQFAFSLSTHAQLLEWCTEDWGPYIESLEERVRKHATAIRLAPVEALARKPPRKSTRPGVRGTTTGFSHYSTARPQPLGIGGRIRSNLSRIASGLSSNAPNPAPADSIPMDTLGDKTGHDDDEEQLDKIFTFDDLQRIRQVTDEAEQAGMMINENRRIIVTVQERYRDLIRSWNNFGGNCSIDRDSLETVILDFCQQLSVFQGDLDSYEARVQLLLRSLERNEEMFQGIIQYGNMRVSEHYARTAETSARSMEEWTERMHDIAAETEHETVSMHGITVLTLIFLPGTFVSTLFSSGIWDFDNSDSKRMGDWQTRVPALKLFLTICIPMMFVCVTLWLVTYRWARGKHLIPEALRSAHSGHHHVGGHGGGGVSRARV